MNETLYPSKMGKSLKTFPGVAMVDEGAGLFVRGGDVSETVILLDQGTVQQIFLLNLGARFDVAEEDW